MQSYLNLKINNDFIKDIALGEVSIGQSLNHHWWCNAQARHLEDQRSGENKASAVRVEEWLGKNLQIVTVEGGEKTIFEGFVFEVELVYERSGAYTILIQAVTHSYKMNVTERHAYYSEMKLADMASKLAQNVQLKASVKCSDNRPLNYVQWGESDFDFLRRVADDHNCWIRPNKDGIEIYDKFQPGTTLAWQDIDAPDHLTSFSLKGALSPPAFDGSHYHFHTMESKNYKDVSDTPQFYDAAAHLVDASKAGSEKTLPAAYLHSRNRVVNLDDYENLLKKESVRSIGSRVTGSGESGNHNLLPGNEVKLSGTLDADGTYGITQVTHSWNPTGYSNHFTCTPWKNYTDPHPPEMKPWYGLVSARVVEHNDPKKMGRVKVQYFWQDDTTAHWARMVTPHAGHNRGFMFMPEEGDEVAVTFEDGDPERPIIVGSLWNGEHPAPRSEFWGGELESNDIKRIVTKSGHRIQFVDKKGKESIVIATPSRLKISLIEKTNENNRSVIAMHSEDGDIYLSAPNGQIHLRSKHYTRETS